MVGNTNNTNLNTAYITYTKAEDAIKAIQALNHGSTNLNSQLIFNQLNGLNGQTGKLNKTSTTTTITTRPTQGILKASLGTTKYCNHWLKNQQCPKLPDCMYLHELAEQEASFTKEDMQKGKHAEYEKKLIQEYLDKNMDKESTINDCDTLVDTNVFNLKSSTNSSDDSNSSNSIDNLVNENQLNDQLNHQMNLNDEDSCCIFSSTNNLDLNNKFGTANNNNLVSTLASSKQINTNQLSCNNNIINQLKSSATQDHNLMNGDSNDDDLDDDSNIILGMHRFVTKQQQQQQQQKHQSNQPQNESIIMNKNLCINSSSSYLDSQQLIKLNDLNRQSINKKTNNDLNDSSSNSTSSTNGLQLFNTTNHSNNTNSLIKSKCINIDNSRGNNKNKLKMNLIDEIIANSSDSSYSTCSSGSNRLNTIDLNEFNNNLLLNGEHFNQLTDTNVKSNDCTTSSIINHLNNTNDNHHHLNNNLIDKIDDEDGLDFDPISISTIGLQDLLKTSTTSSINQNSTSNLNTNRSIFNKTTNINSNLNSLNQLLFSGQQEMNQTQLNNNLTQQLNQLNQLNQMNQLANGVLHNQSQQTKLNSQQINNDRSVLFVNHHLFGNNNSNNTIGSSLTSPINLQSSTQQSQQQQQQQQTQNLNNDPNDAWRDGLRALLPHVNITFANSNSSQNQNNTNNLTRTNSNQNQMNINQAINPQMNQTINQQQLNQQLNHQMNQTMNQNLNHQQQFTPFSLPPGLDRHHLPPTHPLLAFLHQQQHLRQQTAAAGLNGLNGLSGLNGLNVLTESNQLNQGLQFSANFFNQQPPQLKPNQLQQSNQSQTTNQIATAQQNLNNLSRFFPQNFGIQDPQSHQTSIHPQPPPGFI